MKQNMSEHFYTMAFLLQAVNNLALGGHDTKQAEAMCVLLYYVCIVVFTSDAGLLARSQYSEGPATGHLDIDSSWFPCA